jgi:hypothetical protein
MTITVSAFRNDYPEFASSVTYPTSSITHFLKLASLFLNQERWGAPSSGSGNPQNYNENDVGTELYVAHHLVLEARAQVSAASGGLPGENVGAINNKSVDKVSVGFDVSAGTLENAGFWNTTTFGVRFIQLARMMGAGPVQVGANVALSSLNSAYAYQGPWYANTPNPNNSGT